MVPSTSKLRRWRGWKAIQRRKKTLQLILESDFVCRCRFQMISAEVLSVNFVPKLNMKIVGLAAIHVLLLIGCFVKNHGVGKKFHSITKSFVRGPKSLFIISVHPHFPHAFCRLLPKETPFNRTTINHFQLNQTHIAVWGARLRQSTTYAQVIFRSGQHGTFMNVVYVLTSLYVAIMK